MPTHLLDRRHHKPRPQVTIREGIALDRARAHEACGPARYSFALWLAAACEGPVMWIAPAWAAAGLNPDGMMDFCDPARFLFVAAPRGEDILWCMEEALRSGAVPLVVADLSEPPAMTPVRRLHLAAEAGGAAAGLAPLGLLLTPGDGGAPGIESRWHLAPAHAGKQRIWQLQRRRARTQPPRSWQLQQSAPRAALKTCPIADTATG